eukprot:10460186-Heterocapsa_arctica.AAC.1
MSAWLGCRVIILTPRTFARHSRSPKERSGQETPRSAAARLLGSCNAERSWMGGPPLTWSRL